MKLRAMSQRLRSTIATALCAAMVMTSFTVPAYAAEQAEAVENAVVNETAEAVSETGEIEQDVEAVLHNPGVPGSYVSANLLNAGKVTTEYDGTETGKNISAKVNSEGNYVVKWKAVKGAKYYGIAKICSDGSAAPVILKSFADEFKGKSFTDKTGLLNNSMYVVVAYDAAGGAMKKMVVMPESYIMEVTTTIKDNSGVDIYFAAPDPYFTYTLEKSDKKNFKSGVEVLSVSDPQIRQTTVGGVHCFVVHDSKVDNLVGSGISNKAKRYYRVKASFDPKNLPVNYWGLQAMSTKVSKSVATDIVRYNAPSICSIQSGHEEHRSGCAAGVWFWIKPNWVGTSNSFTPNSSSAYYEVEYSKGGKSYTLFCTKKGSTVSTGTAAAGRQGQYGILVTGLTPNRQYSYRIRAKYDGKYSAYSEPMSYYFNFAPVHAEDIVATSVLKNTLEFQVVSERCAEKYVVYNTIDPYETPEKAQAAAQAALNYYKSVDQTDSISSKDLKRKGLKLNCEGTNSKATGAITKFTGKKIKNPGYYGIIVVPKRNDVYGFSQAAATSAFVKNESPSVLSYSSKNDSGFTIKFNKISKASDHIVERLAIPYEYAAELEGDENWTDAGWRARHGNAVYVSFNGLGAKPKKLEVTASATDNTATTALKNQTYVYRFRSVVDGRVSDPTDACIVAQVGPRKPSITAEIVTTNSKYWDYVKTKYRTPSGASVGVRAAKVTVNIGKDKKTVQKVTVRRDAYQVVTSMVDGQPASTEKYVGSVSYNFTPGGVTEGTSYKSSASSFSFYDPNLKRGILYKYYVQVENGSGKSIPGMFKFGVTDNTWKIVSMEYPAYTSATAISSEKGLPIAPGSTTRLYIMTNPIEASEDTMTITCHNTTSFAITGQGTEKIRTVDANGDTTVTRVKYVDVNAIGSTDSTCKMEFEYKYKYDAKGTSAVISDKVFYLRIQ